MKVKGKLAVITYHSVKARQRSKFVKQMEQLTRMGIPVLANIRSPLTDSVHHIAVTFDDGYYNFIENALPVILDKGIPATLFIPVGYLGKMPGWIKDHDHEYFHDILISADKLKDLPTEQIMIGSHTISHPRLTFLETGQVKAELCGSKAMLESLLGKEVDILSFPYNDFDENVIEIARAAGYSRVFSNVPTFPISKIDNFLIGRIDVSPDDWPLEFMLKVTGAYQWLPFAVAVKRRILALVRTNASKNLNVGLETDTDEK